jgi:hypothetical protein
MANNTTLTWTLKLPQRRNPIPSMVVNQSGSGCEAHIGDGEQCVM